MQKCNIFLEGKLAIIKIFIESPNNLYISAILIKFSLVSLFEKFKWNFYEIKVFEKENEWYLLLKYMVKVNSHFGLWYE